MKTDSESYEGVLNKLTSVHVRERGRYHWYSKPTLHKVGYFGSCPVLGTVALKPIWRTSQGAWVFSRYGFWYLNKPNWRERELLGTAVILRAFCTSGRVGYGTEWSLPQKARRRLRTAYLKYYAVVTEALLVCNPMSETQQVGARPRSP